MAQLIDKTIISKYNPRDTRVHWIDISGELPVSKYFINGKWRIVDGSDSSNDDNNNRQDSGYTVTKSYNTYLEQDIETVLDGNYAYSDEYQIDTPLVEGNTYKVTFNGVEYELVCSDNGGDQYLGAAFNYDLGKPDFSIYPFNFITYNEDEEYFYDLSTAEAGTYSIKIERFNDSIEVTPEFGAVVNSVTNGVLILNGTTVNSFTPREATAEDVAKFTINSINVGTLVIDINGCIPYTLQTEYEDSPGDIGILTLGSVVLNEYERTAYYYTCDTLSVWGEASINMFGWYVSDDNTLIASALPGE